jgi:hypothetical protein
MKIKIFGAFLIFALLTSPVFAYTGDVSVNETPITFSSNEFLQGSIYRIYATTKNNSNKDLLGIVRFYSNGSQVGADQAVSIFVGKTDDIFIDWIPNGHGEHTVKAEYFPWVKEEDDLSNNYTATTVYIHPDTDRDGIKNSDDPDDDGDGVPDEEDAFPLNKNEQVDTDGDGTGDNADLDDDNDEVPDEFDDLPQNPDETIDTDGDGIGNSEDTDDDNDQLNDSEEEDLGTDPANRDTDGDSVDDNEDAFPLDPEETHDTDQDNIGDNIDTDDDNDGILDENDQYPFNKGPVIKLKNEDPWIGLKNPYTFDASPSYDEDGEIITFSWKIDGEEKEGNSINHTFEKLGQHDVELSIIDNDGEKKTANFQVNVINLNLYIQFITVLITILLALLIYFKYIARAKNPKKITKKK